MRLQSVGWGREGKLSRGLPGGSPIFSPRASRTSAIFPAAPLVRSWLRLHCGILSSQLAQWPVHFCQNASCHCPKHCTPVPSTGLLDPYIPGHNPQYMPAAHPPIHACSTPTTDAAVHTRWLLVRQCTRIILPGGTLSSLANLPHPTSGPRRSEGPGDPDHPRGKELLVLGVVA